jgi:hypothetical protein
VLRREVK